MEPTTCGSVITTFLQAKMREAKTGVALYSVSSEVDGAKIAGQMATHVSGSRAVANIRTIAS
jgi:hypothetical protein